MKRIYTVFLLLLMFSVYAQGVKVKETFEKGIYFKQDGDKILVYDGYPPEGSVSGNYVFTSTKDGTLEVRARGRGGVSASAYSSPNDVVIFQDVAGNKYWRLIDGTIVKTELAGGESISPVKGDVPVSVKKKIEKEKTVLTTDVEAMVTAKPEQKIQVETTTIETFPASQVKEYKVGDEVRSEEVTTTSPVEGKIIIEEAQIPEGVINISNSADDGIQEIQITDEQVGDVSELFEKNYEDMTRKEKKLYKKNEKKIMKQLERELKK